MDGAKITAVPGFNPLDTASLTKVFVNELAGLPCGVLGTIDHPSVEGAGLYALYYSGDFAAYGAISLAGCDWPIYIGSALPAGARTGIQRKGGKPPIAARLQRHAQSVAAARNLEESHFHARWIEVDEPFIILGEILLTRFYRPLWNSTVPGFGAKAVGGRRTGGRASKWDTLHPGREGMAMAPGAEISRIEEEVARHLSLFPPRLSLASLGTASEPSGP